MGNFEKLSVLVIVVIIVMILVVALYTWQDNGDDSTSLDSTNDVSTAMGEPREDDSSGMLDPGRPQEPVWPRDLTDPGPGSDVTPDPAFVDTVQDVDPIPGPGEEQSGEGGDADPAESGQEGEDPSSEDGGAADEPWVYTVKAGDTLSQICERELGTIRRMKEVMSLNPGLEPLRMRAGDQIKMPPRGRASSTREGGGSTAGGSRAASSRGSKIPTGDYYVSQSGDRIQTIAKRAYGNPDRWPELWARNLSTISNIDDPLPVGTRVFIPK